MRTVILVLLLSVAPAAAAQDPPPSVIVTTGSALVRRAPDVAFIALAVETHAKSPRDAQRQNTEVMTEVVKQIAGAGIPRDALKTIGLHLDQEFDNVSGRRVPRGFAARNTLEVRLDAVERAGELLDTAVQAGATSINGIRFDLKDRAGAEREAIRLAVADARARAEAAAAGAGRSIDRILKIEEGGRAEGPRPMMLRAEAVVVEAGSIDIRAEVTLTVSMR